MGRPGMGCVSGTITIHVHVLTKVVLEVLSSKILPHGRGKDTTEGLYCAAHWTGREPGEVLRTSTLQSQSPCWDERFVLAVPAKLSASDTVDIYPRELFTSTRRASKGGIFQKHSPYTFRIYIYIYIGDCGGKMFRDTSENDALQRLSSSRDTLHTRARASTLTLEADPWWLFWNTLHICVLCRTRTETSSSKRGTRTQSRSGLFRCVFHRTLCKLKSGGTLPASFTVLRVLCGKVEL